MSDPEKPDGPPAALIDVTRLVRSKRAEPPAPEAEAATDESAGPELDAPRARYERPAILKAVALDHAFARRKLMIASLAAGAEACSTSDIAISTEDGACTCHAVCTCDLDDESHDSESVRESDYVGEACVCNTVCSCDTVCTCDTVSTGGGSSGGGTVTYWY